MKFCSFFVTAGQSLLKIEYLKQFTQAFQHGYKINAGVRGKTQRKQAGQLLKWDIRNNRLR
jgi:hypothetical protein